MQQNQPSPSRRYLQAEPPNPKSSINSTSPSIKPKTSTKQCRICLEDEIQSSGYEMLQPCKCVGSVKNVHDRCLKIWIVTSLAKRNKQQRERMRKQGISCQMCKYIIKFETTDEFKCRDCADLAQEAKNKWIFIVVLVFVFSFSLIGIGFTSYIISSNNDELKTKENWNIMFILAICGIILFICFISFGIYMLITEIFLYRTQVVKRILPRASDQPPHRYVTSKNQIIPVEDLTVNQSIEAINFIQ